MTWNFSEGDEFKVGDVILTIEADGTEILTVERTAMNLITRMSGIATKTHKINKLIINPDLPGVKGAVDAAQKISKENLQESFSRGSLYRNRYFGRY